MSKHIVHLVALRLYRPICTATRLLARCRCRQGRALAHYVAAEADFVALAQYELVAEDEQEVVAPLIGVFAYKGRLKAHMRA